MCFIFSLGGCIIATSLVLEPALTWLYKRYNFKPYAHLEWVTNANLQLHRLAHEELDRAKWSDCTQNVPITEQSVFLANLDISDPLHPVIPRWDEAIAEKMSRECHASDADQIRQDLNDLPWTDGSLRIGTTTTEHHSTDLTTDSNGITVSMKNIVAAQPAYSDGSNSSPPLVATFVRPQSPTASHGQKRISDGSVGRGHLGRRFF